MYYTGGVYVHISIPLQPTKHSLQSATEPALRENTKDAQDDENHTKYRAMYCCLPAHRVQGQKSQNLNWHTHKTSNMAVQPTRQHTAVLNKRPTVTPSPFLPSWGGRKLKDEGSIGVSLPHLGFASLDKELSLEPTGSKHPLHDLVVEAVQDPRNHGHGGRPKRLTRVCVCMAGQHVCMIHNMRERMRLFMRKIAACREYRDLHTSIVLGFRFWA